MARQTDLHCSAFALAIFWALGMMLWSGEIRFLPHLMLAACGLPAGLAWFWGVKRLRRGLMARDH